MKFSVRLKSPCNELKREYIPCRIETQSMNMPVLYSYQHVILLRGLPQFCFRTWTVGRTAWHIKLVCSISIYLFPSIDDSTQKYTTIYGDKYL